MAASNPSLRRRESIDAPPLPGGIDEVNRRVEAALRRRILSGRWFDDLVERIQRHFDITRSEVMGFPTLCRNLARTVIQQLSALYDQEPTVSHDDGESEAIKAYTSLLSGSGLWEQGTRLQQRTLFVREGIVRVERVGKPDQPELMFSLVDADMVFASAAADSPHQPNVVVQARRRLEKGTRKPIWTWDAFELDGPSGPRYKILATPSGQLADIWRSRDITADYLDGPQEGVSYPFRYTQGARSGEPFLPFTWYHAARTGALWDPWEGAELVDGTLDIGALWTFWIHGVKDASWPQRYVANARLRGGSTEGLDGSEKYAAVPADPASIMQFISDELAPMIFGQWQAGVDPSALEMAISSFERSCAMQFNLAPSDFEHSGTAESGYAISLKRQSVREAQRRFAPQFRAGDTRLLEISAAIVNRSGMLPMPIPEEDWGITYPSLPMGADERQAAAEKVEILSKAGIQPSKIWTVQQIEQVSRDQALQLLQQWQDDEETVAEMESLDDRTPDERRAADAFIRSMRATPPAPFNGQPDPPPTNPRPAPGEPQPTE